MRRIATRSVLRKQNRLTRAQARPKKKGLTVWNYYTHATRTAWHMGCNALRVVPGRKAKKQKTIRRSL
jgi:hypothetical protein